MSHRPFILLIIPLVLVLAGIIYLSRQSVDDTGNMALRVEQALQKIVPPTGKGEIGEPTWAGLTIRQLAHIAEFAALGLAAGFAVPFFARELSVRTWAGSVALCAVASFLDQVHKLYVPGRHFDGFDLVLDAGGYVVAVTVAHLVLTLTSKAPGHL